MPYVRRRKTAPRRKPTMRRRRIYKPRYNKSQSVHAPKKFVSTWSVPVDSFGTGTHADDYNRLRLDVRLSDAPIFPSLFAMYGQFAITGVKLTYVPEYNSSTGTAGNTVPNIAFAEDKDTEQAQTFTALRAQDNLKEFSSGRKWSVFIKKPRPLLFQQNLGGQAIKTITPSKGLHWLSPRAVAEDPSADLVHLMAQMCVQDIKGIAPLAVTTVGRLYYKMYIAVKEQRI